MAERISGHEGMPNLLFFVMESWPELLLVLGALNDHQSATETVLLIDNSGGSFCRHRENQAIVLIDMGWREAQTAHLGAEDDFIAENVGHKHGSECSKITPEETGNTVLTQWGRSAIRGFITSSLWLGHYE